VCACLSFGWHESNEPHYLTQEEELEARRILLAGARKGDRRTKAELMESLWCENLLRSGAQENKSRGTTVGVAMAPCIHSY
jgi:hypothetical protein